MTSAAINATNLHVGGGVQVAVSFLSELSKRPELADLFDVWVSSEIDHELVGMGVDAGTFGAYSVRNNYGMRQLVNGFNRILRRYDAVFTVYGPLYALRPPRVSVVGFAQAWITYPHNAAYALLRPCNRWRIRLKFCLQAWFFRRADRLVVELPYIRERLHALGWTNEIDVVPNCISGIYRDESHWLPVSVPAADGLTLGIVCRDYPHKNLVILPKVRGILQREYALAVNFVVTLTAAEWRARPEQFRSCMINVGALSVAQCPSFYGRLDGVVFPSLLESSSATPIEALAMGLPLFASDRRFVRDACGDAPIYFDPMNPASIAAAIAGYFRNPTRRHAKLARAYTDPSTRAWRYVEILRNAAHVGCTRTA